MAVEQRNWHGIAIEKFEAQRERWPTEGKHILAQFDDERVLVYQSYNAAIGHYAIENGRFTGAPGWSASRMTWIKPGFLWMCYRNGWGEKDRNQTVTLGIWLKRPAFDRIIAAARTHGTSGEDFTVRLQWDPDHSPSGTAHPHRRAIQLGLKNVVSFVDGDDISSIVDMSEFVAEQGVHARAGDVSSLWTPRETVYPVPDAVRESLHMNVAD